VDEITDKESPIEVDFYDWVNARIESPPCRLDFYDFGVRLLSIDRRSDEVDNSNSDEV